MAGTNQIEHAMTSLGVHRGFDEQVQDLNAQYIWSLLGNEEAYDDVIWGVVGDRKPPQDDDDTLLGSKNYSDSYYGRNEKLVDDRYSNMLSTPSTSIYRKHQLKILPTVKEFNFWKRFPPAFPRMHNWASENVFNAVRNQRDCCCCWAFVACCVIEGTLMATNQINEKVNLSPQDLLNCMNPSENAEIQEHTGCFTSSITKAFRHVKETGVRFEDDCPYVGRREACLSYVEVPRRLLIDDYSSLPKLYDEHEIISILRRRPLGCAIALLKAFLDLEEQIYIGPQTEVRETDAVDPDVSHAVVVVGYGRDNIANINYWHIRNSWGVNWGNEGYARVIRRSSMPPKSESLLTRWCYITGPAHREIESTGLEEHVSTQAHRDVECSTSQGKTDGG